MYNTHIWHFNTENNDPANSQCTFKYGTAASSPTVYKRQWGSPQTSLPV